jgi:hypothetical protein
MTFPLAAVLAVASSGQPVDLTAGLVVTGDTRVRPAVFRIAASDDLSIPAITIRGDGITVDFAGAVLRGSSEDTLPNARQGLGILVEGRNITLRNLKVHGYKVGLIARNSPGIKVLDSDFSYNWKQHLKSTLEREDLSDWMSYHQNEKDEWLRYGAGLYLRESDGFEVRNVKVHGGQNGLMISHSNRGLAWNSDLSFNSSLGIGMFRASDNRIMHNRVDWNVRGYSHGVYNRGQDSAGILIYEQSHRNTFAYNSVTHGGDGFFLWAGQTTMDTGRGGTNDNLLYGNDWSHAPTNGIEATFSRNSFVNNLLLECWHGIWGGYSYDSRVIGNVFGLNAQAIAWEHGQRNLVEHNVFHRDNEAIHIWAKASEDPNWGYPRFRDTRSRDWTIRHNTFRDVTTNVLRLQRTAGMAFQENLVDRAGRVLLDQGDNTLVRMVDNLLRLPAAPELGPADGVQGNRLELHASHQPSPPTMQPSGNLILGLDPDVRQYLARFRTGWNPWHGTARVSMESLDPRLQELLRRYAPAPLAGGIDPFLHANALRGRRYILVDEWGPYDFKSPRLWPRGLYKGSNDQGGMANPSSLPLPRVAPQPTVHRFEVLGPRGAWRILNLRGVHSISARSGSVPGRLEVTLPAGQATDVQIELEYVGEETVDALGRVTPKGLPQAFAYERFFAPIDWEVRWFEWNEQTDPRTEPEAFRRLIAGDPIQRERTDRLDYAWGGRIGPNLPSDRFATVAEGTFEIQPGEYVLDVTTDDGVRVWVDGKLVIDSWKYQGPTLYTADLKLGGRHRIRVEHFEIDGYAVLKAGLRRK